MEREQKLKKELERVEKTRETNRKGRSHLPVIAIVGYTNAGLPRITNSSSI
jgi:GTPase